MVFRCGHISIVLVIFFLGMILVFLFYCVVVIHLACSGNIWNRWSWWSIFSDGCSLSETLDFYDFLGFSFYLQESEYANLGLQWINGSGNGQPKGFDVDLCSFFPRLLCFEAKRGEKYIDFDGDKSWIIKSIDEVTGKLWNLQLFSSNITLAPTIKIVQILDFKALHTHISWSACEITRWIKSWII